MMKPWAKKICSLTTGIFGIIIILFFARIPLSKAISNSATLEKQNQNSSICQPDPNQGFSSQIEVALQAIANISTTKVIAFSKESPFGPQFSSHHISFDDEELPSGLHEPLDDPYESQSFGTGFIIQSTHDTAYIVTNYHVIAAADKISISLNDRTELDAMILGVDPHADLAILKVSTSHLPIEQRKLPTLEWADSHRIRVGDFVLAIGNSFGFGSTVSHGIISNLSRRLRTPQANRSYTTRYIQHSAPIHAGNSGGPLLNCLGQVIGVNTVIISPNGENVGIGLSIPSATASARIKQLIEFGRIRAGWLGIKTQLISGDTLVNFNLDKTRNYRIVGSVTPFGPGAKANIEPGDLILEFDGKEITESTNLSQLICEAPIGRAMTIKVYRDGRILTITAIPEELEENLPHDYTLGQLTKPI